MNELPDSAWNRFIGRACEQAIRRDDESDLYALFWYQAEVNNGGHLQYFHNRGDYEEWGAAARAARIIGQIDIAELIETTGGVWQSQKRRKFWTLRRYVKEALQCEFGAEDQRFGELSSNFDAAFMGYIEDRGRDQDAFDD